PGRGLGGADGPGGDRGHFPDLEYQLERDEGVGPVGVHPEALQPGTARRHQLAVVDPGAVAQGEADLSSLETLQVQESVIRHRSALSPVSPYTAALREDDASSRRRAFLRPVCDVFDNDH